MDVRDAVVLVTGASGAIGAASAAALHQRGARVILTARDAGLSDVAADIGAKALICDLTRPGTVDQLVADALDVYGSVDAVLHCAGIGWFGSTATMSSGQVDDLLDVNVRAALQLSRALLPGMVSRGRGHLAFVASIAGWTGVAQEAVYSATKAALITYAEALRAELAGTGVGVSVVSPAAVHSDFWDTRGAPYERRFPRLVSAERVARVIVRGIEQERAHRMVPRWLALAPAVRAVAPGAYRAMQRRFG